uniref:procollagen-proline 4-dioxygenase n=1 Tax=Tetraselmis chuii TaxID=63592 RepID=A0A7S1X534_9CHLO|mmetsp:Transcript_30011/g.53702  ORF Transcript_30011/g.53702 Transcript_30011/m.53702 type:complete len:343 (+) Transcript_30011:175-1203(+)|eukprot:CAMPEP_0177779978 /NCGR_PEP_ID=MMETSP0491_2-20121128/16936_1 /TAXON_ID=63592 /ORGANISM="Tetraselmis chuii, Strain PLY429" /LENGTH=342 /DNA_ID=CAMNT_0019299675 /DNA_START=133 /DNA_END=1161 /DNA_ORIENTATION=+
MTVLLVLLALFAPLACTSEVAYDDERLIGWKGETHRQAPASSDTEPWVETITHYPRAYLFHNFLSPEECDHIIELADPVMERSTVVGNGGKGVLDNIRTSSGTFIPRKVDATITTIEERIARYTHIPLPHQEDMQVLKYVDGQKYGAHYDSLVDGSPRIATVLMYLSDVEEGGETAFPKAFAKDKYFDPAVQGAGSWSACAREYVAARPKKGDALLFYSLNPDLRQDQFSFHTGCPVIAGTKWSATAWIHTEPFRPEDLLHPAHLPQRMWQCENVNESCEAWARAGECEKNPVYMVGSPSKPGECRPACNLCRPCPDGEADKQCILDNTRMVSDFLKKLRGE